MTASLGVSSVSLYCCAARGMATATRTSADNNGLFMISTLVSLRRSLWDPKITLGPFGTPRKSADPPSNRLLRKQLLLVVVASELGDARQGFAIDGLVGVAAGPTRPSM